MMIKKMQFTINKVFVLILKCLWINQNTAIRTAFETPYAIPSLVIVVTLYEIIDLTESVNLVRSSIAIGYQRVPYEIQPRLLKFPDRLESMEVCLRSHGPIGLATK